jgi:transcriptional regulator with XRE-family HTH domain
MSTEVRRARIKALVDKAKRDEGLNQAQFARKHGLDPTHLSQMLKGKRGIGNAIAMRIEDSLMLERGYLDRPVTLHRAAQT